MQKNKDKRPEKSEREISDFSLYDKSGRQKTFALSIIAAAVGFLSVLLVGLGIAYGIVFSIIGICFGVAAITLSVIARVKLGYFNSFIIIGIFLGIFSTVIGIFTCIYTAYLPDILEWIRGAENQGAENV